MKDSLNWNLMQAVANRDVSAAKYYIDLGADVTFLDNAPIKFSKWLYEPILTEELLKHLPIVAQFEEKESEHIDFIKLMLKRS